MINVSRPDIGQAEIDAVTEVLKSGNIASGHRVHNFEEAFSEYVEQVYGIATSSGTTALHTALLTVGVKAGDEVICPAYSFFSTGSMISACSAKPIFSDIYNESYSIWVDEVENLITEKTKAIIAVHMFGREAKNIDTLCKMCIDYNVPLIIDSCQAPTRWSAIYGDITCYSFYATKNMTTGEGGMMTTNNDSYADTARQIINHGQSARYKHTRIGYNYRMTDIAAAIGLVQLEKIDMYNDRRREIAMLYDKYLRGTLHLYVPEIVENHAYHQYTVEVFTKQREPIRECLKERGIETAIHYPEIIPKQPIYRKYYSGIKFPAASKTVARILSLPCNNVITNNEVKTVSDALKQCLSHKREMSE